MITCRGDGREITLTEFPLAQQFTNADTVRAEEITLSLSDGRLVAMLVNATPIRSADGEVESMVVTLQDLAPLKELERLRTEFLSMVNHELRAPLTSIIGSVTTLLRASPGLDPAETHEFFRIIDEQAGYMRGLLVDLLDQGRIETGTVSLAPEPAEVAGLVEQARHTFQGGGGTHALSIDLPDGDNQVERDRENAPLRETPNGGERHADDSQYRRRDQRPGADAMDGGIPERVRPEQLEDGVHHLAAPRGGGGVHLDRRVAAVAVRAEADVAALLAPGRIW